jgi:UPF0755 protein
MKAVKPSYKWLYFLALVPAILGISAYLGWSWWLKESAPPVAASQSTSAADKAVQIKITSGMASGQIGSKLEEAGLIRSSQAWKLWARWLSLQDKQGEFKSGMYKLSPTQPLPEIAEQIWKGKVTQLDFTIPEGWSIQQMAEYFEAQGLFKAQDFLAATRKIPKDKYPWLPDGLPHLEGFLYPDTYKLASDNITPEAAINQMLGRFEKLALPLYKEAQNRTKLNLLQWVTLASIVEKEAVVPPESPRIAGVFIARLQQGITLGSDPTVEYGLGIRQTADRPLTLEEVKRPSPYNTYINQGLPPGPISSPGLGSLKAVLAPENTDYLYFVARYDGTHVFSRTLQEHVAATNAIRRQRQAR